MSQAPRQPVTHTMQRIFRFVEIEAVRLVGAENVAPDAAATMCQALGGLDAWRPAGVVQVA